MPIGSPEFIAARAAARLQEEAGLLTELPELPDLQAAWLLLTFCAAPRAQHLLRTVPPSLSRQYANDHDEAIWQTLLALLGRDDAAPPTSRHLAFLPARLGGLGLFGAALAAPAAYWAGWVDSLAVLAQRAPAAADRYLRDLVRGPAAAAACLREADAAAQQLDAAGWQGRPTWTTLADQAVPPPPPLEDSEPGLWRHGWQHPAALALTTSFRERTVFPQLSLATRALVRSQAGAAAGAWLSTIPSRERHHLLPARDAPGFAASPPPPPPHHLGRCGQAPGTHGCGRALDPYGDHMAACPRTGALARRGHLLEQAWVRVCREAVGPEGRVIPQQWLAATTAQPIPADDRRRLDLVIHGATPLGHALCCDATLVSPLTRDGAPWARAADQDGIALVHARRRKERRYPELLRPGPHRFLVLACETGGRWSRECHDLLRLLVATRARRAHAAIRAAASTAWRRRWWGILSATQQRAIASTLLGSNWVAPLRFTPPYHPPKRRSCLPRDGTRSEKKKITLLVLFGWLRNPAAVHGKHPMILLWFQHVSTILLVVDGILHPSTVFPGGLVPWDLGRLRLVTGGSSHRHWFADGSLLRPCFLRWKEMRGTRLGNFDTDEMVQNSEASILVNVGYSEFRSRELFVNAHLDHHSTPSSLFFMVKS